MGAAVEGLGVNGVSQKTQSAVDPGPRRPDRPNRYSMITLDGEVLPAPESLRHDLSSDFSCGMGDGVNIRIGPAILHRLGEFHEWSRSKVRRSQLKARLTPTQCIRSILAVAAGHGTGRSSGHQQQPAGSKRSCNPCATQLRGLAGISKLRNSATGAAN
jgi:hypothetical protein